MDFTLDLIVAIAIFSNFNSGEIQSDNYLKLNAIAPENIAVKSLLNYSNSEKLSQLTQVEVNQTLQNHQPKPLQIETLQGKLSFVKIPPGRSVRAYLGAEFFLEVNELEGKSLTLLPSQKISREELQTFHHQTVKIQAIYRPGKRPDRSKVSCPIDSSGLCIPQGEGYQVLSITKL